PSFWRGLYYFSKEMSNCVKARNWRSLFKNSLSVSSNIRSVANFSTQNEAKFEPKMIAFFKLSKDMFSLCVMYPQKPPAKVSPAPVGSKTSSSGRAGAKNTSDLLNNNAP